MKKLTPETLNMNPIWYDRLESEFEKPYFEKLWNEVGDAYEKSTCFPPKRMIFEAFNQCDWENLKVVIIGQDPYHGMGEAHGLSFSVPDGTRIPPSLRNIFKELNEDCKYSSRVLLYSDAQQQVIDLREKEVLLDALIDKIKDKIDKNTLPVDLHTHFTRLLTILNEMSATLHKNIPTAVAELNERYKDRVELNVAFVAPFKHIKTKFKMIMAKRNT